MSQAHEKGHYRELEEGETFASKMDSIRENMASVSASRKVTEEKLTELLKKVADPEAKRLLKKTLRTLRHGAGEVKP